MRRAFARLAPRLRVKIAYALGLIIVGLLIAAGLMRGASATLPPKPTYRPIIYLAIESRNNTEAVLWRAVSTDSSKPFDLFDHGAPTWAPDGRSIAVQLRESLCILRLAEGTTPDCRTLFTPASG